MSPVDAKVSIFWHYRLAKALCFDRRTLCGFLGDPLPHILLSPKYVGHAPCAYLRPAGMAVVVGHLGTIAAALNAVSFRRVGVHLLKDVGTPGTQNFSSLNPILMGPTVVPFPIISVTHW